MVEHLVELLPEFDSQRSRVRCFLHVLSLVVKALIREFDVRPNPEADEKDNEERELLALANDLQVFEMEHQRKRDVRTWGKLQEEDDEDAEEDEAEADDGSDDLDPLKDMTEAERKQFEKDVRPVKLAIMKVSNFSHILYGWKLTF